MKAKGVIRSIWQQALLQRSKAYETEFSIAFPVRRSWMSCLLHLVSFSSPVTSTFGSNANVLGS